MTLSESLSIRTGEMLSLIGAGGKTTTLFRLAKELREQGGKILVTTTTWARQPTKPHVDRLFLIQDADAFIAESHDIARPAIIGAGHAIDSEGKLLGLPAPWLDEIHSSGQFDSVMVEADNAASRLFKVPAETEPLVPSLSHLVVWVMAVRIIGKPLAADTVHGAERAAALLGVPLGTILTGDHILSLLGHRDGCLKGTPASSRKIALINQADSDEEVEIANGLAFELLALGFERAVITSFAGDNLIKAAIQN